MSDENPAGIFKEAIPAKFMGTVKISDKYIFNGSSKLFLSLNGNSGAVGINKFSHIIEKDKISKLNKNLNYLDKIYDLAKSFKHEIQNNNSDDLKLKKIFLEEEQ